MQSLIDDPAERLEVAFRGRAHAMRLSPERQAARYLEVDASLLKETGGRASQERASETPSPTRRREPTRASP